MGLINLKTDLKSLKYGNDRPGGGSSNQPYIVTPIPDGLTANGPDFLLRQGALKASLTDVSRLTKWFSDPLSVNGLLFTTKQIALERQNPKIVNTNRVYLPTNTITQAGALAVGSHFNKQGLDPLSPLSYFAGGQEGYYFATKGIGEHPTGQTLSSGEIENRLTIAYTAKIADQPLGNLAINPFGVTGLNPNVLLSYTGGPNAPLGLGTTNIRIQNPTIKLKDAYEFGEDQAKAIYENPNVTTTLLNQNFVSHKEPVYLYNPDFDSDTISSRYGASYTYYRLAASSDTSGPLISYLFTNVNPLTRDNITIYNKPLGNSNVSVNYISTDPSKPGYLTPQRANGGIAPTNNYNIDQIMSVGATQAYLDIYKDKGLGEGTGFKLIDTEPKEIVERNSATKPIEYPEYREGVSTPNYVNWVYDPTKEGASSQYESIPGVNSGDISESLFGSNSPLNRDETNTGIIEYNPQQIAENTDNNVFAYTYKNIIDQGTSDVNISGEATPQVLSKYKTTQLSYITDYRQVINKTNPNSDLPETNYKAFNREDSYNISRTFYKKSINNNNTSVNNDPNNVNPYAFSVDQINASSIIESNKVDDTKFINGTEITNSDLAKFFFEINNNNSSGDNFFLFFRAYINNLSDSFQADWQSYKYVGRGENFYRYSGFSRDMQLSFTVYAHSRAEMIPLYKKLNYLAGVTAPDYSDAGYMRGNFVNITVGDYINSVPSIIKNISLKPSFEAGWDINRKEDGNLFSSIDNDLNVGQVPRLIDVDLSFIPLHNFTPQFKKDFIRNINSSLTNSSTSGVGGEPQVN